MKRHEEQCNASSSGAGTKRPLTRENDNNMVLDKRAKSNPFTIDVVSSALQDSVCRWKIDYPEDLEEADILNTLHDSIHSMKTTIQRYQQKQKALKVQMVLQDVFVKVVDPTVTTDPVISLTSEVFASTDIPDCLEKT